MVNFILNEARDKAEEIEAKTLQDFNLESLKFQQQEKEKIRNEFSKKKKTAETQRAIARSTAINKARLMKIEARQDLLQQLNEECRKGLANQVKQAQDYQKLLTDLIAQGALKLMEDSVTVRCRKEDVSLVQMAARAAGDRFSEAVKKETGVVKKVTIQVDTSTYLNSDLLGGVVLLCADNSIKVDNTLDTRLALELQNDLPALRKMLFQH